MTQPGSANPFILRGHHIDTLTPLMYRFPRSPEQMAHDLRQSSESDRGGLTDETLVRDILAAQKIDDEYWAAYAYDLIGETEPQADAFEESYQTILTTFSALPDTAAVRLTSRELDGLCGACTMKIHCHDQEVVDSDSAYIDVFEDVVAFAQAKDPSEELVVSRSDNGDILTSAKTVRRVMAHFALATTWQYDLYKDALNRRKAHGNVFAGQDESKLEKYYRAYGHEIS